MISPTVQRDAELRMWIAALDSKDWRMRLLAGEKVCEMAGLSDAVRALAPGGWLRPAPEWPRVDIAPSEAHRDADGPWLMCVVRTLVHGVLMTEQVRVGVPLVPGALEDAVERGRAGLSGRLL